MRSRCGYRQSTFLKIRRRAGSETGFRSSTETEPEVKGPERRIRPLRRKHQAVELRLRQEGAAMAADRALVERDASREDPEGADSALAIA